MTQRTEAHNATRAGKAGAPDTTPRPVSAATAEAGRRVHEAAARAVEAATSKFIAAPLLPPEFATLATPSALLDELAAELARPAYAAPEWSKTHPPHPHGGARPGLPYVVDPPYASKPLTEASKAPPAKWPAGFDPAGFDFAAAEFKTMRGAGKGLSEFQAAFERMNPPPTWASTGWIKSDSHAGERAKPPRIPEHERMREHRQRTARFSLEHEAPEAYVKDRATGVPASLEGPAELTTFRLDVVALDWNRDAERSYPFGGGPAFEFPRRKRLTVHVRVAPRKGDSPFTVNRDERGKYIDLYANMTFAYDRPDALCIREIMLNFVRHEVEESILVNGVRVWDPHVGRPGGI